MSENLMTNPAPGNASHSSRPAAEWSLREEILASAQSWPWIVLFILAGSLLGWGVSLVWPTPHQAETELYVGLNPYRALEDRNVVVQFNYVDDYKNWQMSDLDVLVTGKEITQATLERLRQEDPYWQGVSREDLRAMLHVYWRNAGKWRLVAENPQAGRAVQAVNAWQAAILEGIGAAITQAQETFTIDTQLQAVAAAQAQAEARQAQLNQLQTAWQGWVKTAQGDLNRTVPEAERQGLWAAYQAAAPGPALQALGASFPAQGAPASGYLAWLEGGQAALGAELQSAQAQSEALGAQHADLARRYTEAAGKSWGLSANLSVERVSDQAPDLTVVRPSALLALVGGTLGLLAWLLAWLVRMAQKARP